MSARRLSPEEELRLLAELYGEGNYAKFVEHVTRSFDVLQSRSQTLLGLVTICLTISGFSGPNIAASSVMARNSLVVGLSLVLASAVLILSGPLQLRWATQWHAGDLPGSIVQLLRRRNSRTRTYHAAFLLIVAGLTGYVFSVVHYLYGLPPR